MLLGNGGKSDHRSGGWYGTTDPSDLTFKLDEVYERIHTGHKFCNTPFAPWTGVRMGGCIGVAKGDAVKVVICGRVVIRIKF